MSLAPSLTHAPSVHSGRAGLIALWIVQIALAGMFLLAGGSKLLDASAMVALFARLCAAHARTDRRLLRMPTNERAMTILTTAQEARAEYRILTGKPLGVAR